MTPLTDLLAEATASGVTLEWLPDGGLRVRGGTPELRRAIGARKPELAACPGCSAVVPAGVRHCGPPPAPEPDPETWHACSGCGTILRQPQGQPIPECPNCAPPAALVRMRCGTCFAAQWRPTTGPGQCASCGNPQTVWITRCEMCQLDARPGATTCVDHQEQP